MHDKLPCGSRKPTARTNPERFAHNDLTVVRLSAPAFIVATRKIAARVSGTTTA
jgi:hypothetical protein